MNGIGLGGESHGIFWARRNSVAAVVAAIFVFIAMLAMASPARAANIVVTSNADSGAGTLRAAVATASGNTEADTITFDLPAGSRTITLDSQIGFGTTTYNTTVDGTGQSVTVSGNNASRVFHVREGNPTVKRLTVSDGNRTGAVAGCCDTEGGGIYNDSGILTVTQSTISGNTAGDGGGIFSSTNLTGTSTTTIENSTISGNRATDEAGRGGGIYNSDGRMYITGSTITNNYAPTKYQSSGGGAGVASFGDAFTETVVANSIISDNSSDCSSGSACNFRHDGDVDFVNDTHNSFTSQGHNIIGDSSLEYAPNTCGQCKAIDDFNQTGDQRGVTDPKLGPLQDNGGPTQTHALLTGSPAINRGSTTLATDQRGVSRPQGAADDVGAFELEWVNTAPVAGGQSVTTSEDVAKKITLAATDADNDPRTYKVGTLPTGGTLYKGDATNPANQTNANKVVVNTALPGAEVTYVPNANYTNDTTTPDTFSFVANDGTADSNTATVNITVNAVNDAPVATDDTAETEEDTALNDIAVLTNDTDVDGDSLSVSSVTQPSHGSASLVNGKVNYTPTANYSGTDFFTYKANDGSLDSNVATVGITIDTVNDAPVAEDDSATTDEDTPANIDVITNDTDVENANAEIVVSSFAQPSNGTLTYAPVGDFHGTDSFTYEVCDGGDPALCDTATVTMTVTSVPDACTVRDTDRDDVLRGTADRDVICGGRGNDTFYGRGGNDLIRGGTGKDTVHGNAGDDTLLGRDGRDRLYGGEGDDRLLGDAGTDLLNGGSGVNFTQQ